jgi:calcium-dependent protein kinase
MKSIPLSQSIEIGQLMIEVSILKELDHPNIVRIFEVINDEKTINIFMEHCTGGELYERIERSSHFSESLASQYMLDMVSAIKYCHEAKLVHRDLKPENILFENNKENARLKIIDFGTSKYFKPNEKMQKFIGTSYYVAPEVIDKNYDEKCDIWSLGVILYVMLCGSPPFYGKTTEDTYNSIKTKKVAFKSKNWETVSEEAKSLIRCMLIKDPIKRPSIHDVYMDPWIQNNKNRIPESPLAKSTLENMRRFQNECNLRRITMSYIISQLVVNEEVDELRKVFESLDRDGNGKLTKNEIIEGFKYTEISDIDIERVVTECDTDNNGFLDYTEFLTATCNWQKITSKNRLLSAFKAFDNDGNGKISYNDLIEALKSTDVDDKQIKEIFERADVNGDGEIDLKEFERIMMGKNYNRV